MKLLRLAIETKRWDLAAHTVILAAAKVLREGEKPVVMQKKNGRRSKG